MLKLPQPAPAASVKTPPSSPTGGQQRGKKPHTTRCPPQLPPPPLPTGRARLPLPFLLLRPAPPGSSGGLPGERRAVSGSGAGPSHGWAVRGGGRGRWAGRGRPVGLRAPGGALLGAQPPPEPQRNLSPGVRAGDFAPPGSVSVWGGDPG